MGEAALSVIRVAGVRKRFRKYTTKGQYTTIKTSLLGRFLGRSQPAPHFQQILEGIDFEVPRGSVLGLIGRNGSGKSTLLKLIAGILKPDAGRIEVDGRISPLIELGAGFHPEFSGRENVILNGLVLGMSRGEIDERFDAIVDFAELWDSIDDPVRTYSSGMYMRLGFSIAIHSSPDILLIDEILAVGDQSFSLKCQQWLADFLGQGNTAVLVSHDANAIERWCHEVIWLDGGRIRERGAAADVLRSYHATVRPEGDDTYLGKTVQRRHRPMRIDGVRVVDDEGIEQPSFRPGEPFVVEVHCRRVGGDRRLGLTIAVRRPDGHVCFVARSLDADVQVGAVHGEGRVRCRFGSIPLLDGVYTIDVVTERDDETIMGEDLAATVLRIESGEVDGKGIPVEQRWEVEWKANEAANR